jgi:TMEM199 family protein
MEATSRRCTVFRKDMVQLTITTTAKAAIETYCKSKPSSTSPESDDPGLDVAELAKVKAGDPIEHHALVEVSRYLLQQAREEGVTHESRSYRLDALLKGACVYRPPPPRKPEPVRDILLQYVHASMLTVMSQTPEYKALMQKLREEEERRQYERMINPPSTPETFSQRYPSTAGVQFHPAISHGQFGADLEDDVTYQDVNRQIILIINVLISIICCSVFIWIAARRWSVPQRLGLSMSGSGLVAFAEVAIYIGYIKRVQDAKVKEKRVPERKEVVETWVIDRTKASPGSGTSTAVRHRKGKHG